MKKNFKTIMKELTNKKLTVVNLTKTEFELDNGNVFPHIFELEEDVSIEDFQKLLDESKSMMVNHLNKIIKGGE